MDYTLVMTATRDSHLLRNSKFMLLNIRVKKNYYYLKFVLLLFKHSLYIVSTAEYSMTCGVCKTVLKDWYELQVHFDTLHYAGQNVNIPVVEKGVFKHAINTNSILLFVYFLQLSRA